MLDPAEAGLNAEDALAPRLVDQVVQDNSVGRIVASVCDVRFVVLEDLILLDVTRGSVDQKDSLAVVGEDQVVKDLD